MKNQRAILFFLFAIAFGVAAVFMVDRALDRQPEAVEAAAVPTTRVVLAKRDLATGGIVSAQQLESVEWPSDFVPKGAFSSVDQLQGRVLRRALAAGEPVLEPSLLPTGAAGGLASTISENARAISVKVDPIVGVAGFVTPGSHVDVLVTVRRVDQSSKLPVTKVVLQDVRVLAIDQRMEEPKTGEPELVSVVTLEVTPVQGEKLTYSAHEGRLQLALRSPADRELVKTAGVSVRDLVSRAKPRTQRTGVQVLKGTSVSVKTF